MTSEAVEVLRLTLHGVTVGYLAGYQGGKNILVFDATYVTSSERPTLTLAGTYEHPKSQDLFANPWVRQQRLHPVLSNLLPEGSLRDMYAQELKVHPDNEFPLIAQLGSDLPGALIAEPVAPDQIPMGVLEHRTHIVPIPRKVADGRPYFSLAGVQLKFSMHRANDRFMVSQPDELGDWIVKTPSIRHRDVPANEYSVMRMAAMAGVEIPDVELVTLGQLESLPPINLPSEQHAYAIRRFDRDEQLHRVHTEDFAQVLFKYAHEKYGTTNFEEVGKVIYRFTGHGLANVQQMARRLLVNILLGNGDAHLKNWSLIYPDQVTAELAPAYDIVYTQAYIPGESELSLNLAGNKNWYAMRLEHFESWSRSVGVPWRAVRPHLEDVIDVARRQWPLYLDQAPMNPDHKRSLRDHWRSLDSGFGVR